MKIKLTKGLDLPIAGRVEELAPRAVAAARVAIVPDDYPGFTPKVDVAVGDVVEAGAPLMHDKTHPGLKLVAPVAGTVKAVERGERRKLLRVEIEAAGDARRQFDTTCNTPQEAAALLAECGLLALVRQRPYAVVPSPDVLPRDIFVTAIYSAPLELPVSARVAADDKPALDAAAQFLAGITTGKVYISHNDTWTLGPVAGAEMVVVQGPHPAGLPGVQAANIRPVDKGDVVWTLDVETLLRIGRLLLTRTVDMTAVVAVSGPAVKAPYVARTVVGAEIEPLLKITVLDEGDDVDEFMGWASLSPSKMSVSRTFPGHFLKRLFRPDARVLGGRRAMIMSGEYDAMMPMDIMPEYLLKAIIARDIDNMERLGIYEVAPEDFALAEYADTSKLPLQNIVREGLDYLRKELE